MEVFYFRDPDTLQSHTARISEVRLYYDYNLHKCGVLRGSKYSLSPLQLHFNYIYKL